MGQKFLKPNIQPSLFPLDEYDLRLIIFKAIHTPNVLQGAVEIVPVTEIPKPKEAPLNYAEFVESEQAGV